MNTVRELSQVYPNTSITYAYPGHVDIPHSLIKPYHYHLRLGKIQFVTYQTLQSLIKQIQHQPRQVTISGGSQETLGVTNQVAKYTSVLYCRGYLIARQLLIFFKDKTKIKLKFSLLQRTVLGFIVGFVSSLMGIGGAIMNVPILKFVGYTINKAIGSAASIGFLISVFGCLGFLASGMLIKNDIPLSAGFINIPAFLIFIPITIMMAKIGATTVHKMKKEIIAKLFGFFLIIIASRFLYDYFNF